MSAEPLPCYTERFSVAPMLDWTDRHCRFFHRMLCPDAVLYTEMVVAEALCHTDNPGKFLNHDHREAPLVLQLGGSNPQTMARAVAIAERHGGFYAYNINVGCPSDRVQDGRFGACLMAEPATVAACISAMRQETAKPITVKTRLGIDDHSSADFRYRFLDAVAAAGAAALILHARIALLKGLSPKDNRTIPPLQYDAVYAARQRYTPLPVILNGGVHSMEALQEHLLQVEGVMAGRKPWHEPWWLTSVSGQLFNRSVALTRLEAARQYQAYVQALEAAGTAGRPLLLQPLHGLFHGLPAARLWRTMLTQYDRSLTASQALRLAIEYREGYGDR
jgi:tRNA-dihydrouridine synthase A